MAIPPHFTSTPPFQSYPPFLAKFLVPPLPPPQVTQFMWGVATMKSSIPPLHDNQGKKSFVGSYTDVNSFPKDTA